MAELRDIQRVEHMQSCDVHVWIGIFVEEEIQMSTVLNNISNVIEEILWEDRKWKYIQVNRIKVLCEIYDNRLYASDFYGFLLFFNVDSLVSVDKLKENITEIKKRNEDNGQIVLVGLCAEKDSEQRLPFTVINEFAVKQGLVYTEISSLSPENIDSVIFKCVEGVLERSFCDLIDWQKLYGISILKYKALKYKKKKKKKKYSALIPLLQCNDCSSNSTQ
eukprot:TRINITY_DN946_c0_g1_i4.p1 TRINITY_DN946_c0_g1~~TRINITY_DN946_c0_g1_i4.p1  ORF type:complete len:220 (-),score=43.18 TRINITY_DN946_c0_g1_i4:38-697(-)